MSNIFANDKVKNQYQMFVCIKEEERDMRIVAKQYENFGYKKIIDEMNNNEVILIYCKEIK